MLKTFTRTLTVACFLFSFLISSAQNEVELRLIPIDCDYGMTAFLAGAGDYVATYDWGDGTTSIANWAYVDHTYSTPGEYTVTVVNDFITYVETVSIEECSCPTSLEPVQIYGQCSSVSMRFDTYIYSLSDYNIEWNWGDGTTSTSGWYPTGYHAYAEEGAYEICGFFTGPGCEDGVELCTTVDIQFCDEPCYYEPPYFEYDQNSCTYTLGVIEAPQEIIWFSNGEEIGFGPWLSGVSLPTGTNEICMDILPNLDWSCPLGYSECFIIDVPETTCGTPEFSYEETSCGILEFEFNVNGAPINVTSVHFGDGVSQDLANGQNFEHYYSYLPGVYEVCVEYFENGSTFLSEYCYEVEVEGCPEQFCWAEIWGEETECGIVQMNLWTELDVFQSEDVYWDFGDGSFEYGFGWAEHEYEEPGVYVICAEIWNEYCPNGIYSCFTIEVLGCEEECTQPLFYEEVDCGEYYFSIGENYSVEFANWDFGDGTTAQSPMDVTVNTTHQYETSGIYEVCVEYFDLECQTQSMHEACFTIEVEVCDENCSEIVYTFTDCLVAEFFYEGEADGFYDQWVVMQDGAVYLDYETQGGTTITFPSAGSYQVGVSDALDCDGNIQPYFIDVYVEECSECPEITTESLECNLGEFSYFGEIDYSTYSTLCWEVYNENGGLVSTYLDGEYTDFNFPGSGVYTVLITNAVPCDGEIPSLEVEIDCVDFCEGELSAQIFECGLYDIWVPDGATNISINYTNFNDPSIYGEIGIPEGESNVMYQFQDSGVYSVTAQYIHPLCGLFVSATLTLVPETCDEPCPVVNIENIECEYGLFSYYGEIDYSTYSTLCWEVYDDNGNLLSTYLDGELTDYNFPTSGVYTVLVTNAVPCNGVIPSVEVEIEDCETDCSVQLEYTADCNDVIIYIPGEATEFYLDFGNGTGSNQTSWVTYEVPGTYEVCGEFYMPECEEWVYDCIEVIVEDCEEECDFELTYLLECNELTVYMPDIVSSYFINYGNGMFGEIQETIVYDEPGVYTVCYEVFMEECDQWTGDCIEIIVEDCDVDCVSELMAEDLGCGLYEISVTEGSSNIYLGYYQNNENYADLIVAEGEHSIQIQFEESGFYSVWTEYIHPDCGYYVGGEIQFEVELCENDCEPVTLTFDGDFGDLEEFTELVSGVITGDDGVVWEGLIPFSNFVTSVTVELCIPPGCYSFEIMNEDPLALLSLSMALQSINTDEINVLTNIDLVTGSLETTLGVMEDCSTGIEEQTPEMVLYPNPSSDIVNLQFENAGWNYQILDVTGRLVHTGVSTDNSERLDVTKWADGMYILNAVKNENTLHAKFQVKK